MDKLKAVFFVTRWYLILPHPDGYGLCFQMVCLTILSNKGQRDVGNLIPQTQLSPQKAKFAKISCVDGRPGEPPGLLFGTPGGPTPSHHAWLWRARNTIRRAEWRSDSFSIPFSGVACDAQNYFQRGCGFCLTYFDIRTIFSP
jgi:hypothetical protein